ncbi:MAG: menaquinone biosynthesis protein [Bacteroidota bacterium]
MKLRIALVSYINTRPFTDGLRKSFSLEELELQLRPPAECARALAMGTCDMALIPVGSLIDFTNIRIIGEYCIGADGAVDSVFIFSQRPIEECTHLRLDQHSRSSNGLARILLKHYWHNPLPHSVPEKRDFSLIQGNTAGVAIGDRAYQIRDQFAYVYDLAQVWKDWTGLPFVFAVWAYDPQRVSFAQLEQVRKGLQTGLLDRKGSARRWAQRYDYTIPQAEKYLTESISYELNGPKQDALRRYFAGLRELDLALQT